jgi:predicted CoA-substrate-specific enzyme activase
MERGGAGAGRGALFAGIDCGSSFCKGALLRDGDVVALTRRPTGWNVKECYRLVLEELLEAGVTGVAGEAAPDSPDSRSVALAATGYGREQVAAVTLGGITLSGVTPLTEIGAHARGAEFLFPGVRTVIDIGGQDGKVIAVEQGRVRDFQMNDKCAAGCGRFLEMVIKRLELDASRGEVEELLALDMEAPLNSTCAVFAESEIIGLLAAGVSRAAILGGAAASLSRRIAALAGRTGVLSPAVITGGLSESPGIRKILSRVLEAELRPVPHGMYAGAIGAALYAATQLYG